MKTVFIAAGGIEWGSSRMRAYWVAAELQRRGQGARVLQYGNDYPKADAYVWQKLANPDVIAFMDGRHYWDVCDPSWWWQPGECREIADKMTAVIASSQPLADDFNQWYGEDKAVCIPDRLDLTHFTKQRQHADVSPVRFIWFGVVVNRIALLGAIPFLERLVANGHKIELTIIDDRPDLPIQWTNAFPIYHTKWTLDTEVEIIASHDIALLPPYPGAWGKVKSNNKQLTAWACGLPVLSTDHYYQYEYLMQSVFRYTEAESGRTTLDSLYTIDKSAAQWETILCAS